ncbi:RING-H2 finger protein ATL16 [Acorus calamus]|uniref:RING-type E3 ubiquitin transferase n=1 Tax=Acorus calamus TaxID=4465 RepID=A0AAV9C3V3_ACOCL|nr:RING-H2 finger protein ATL16 [Acorus calamus]
MDPTREPPMTPTIHSSSFPVLALAIPGILITSILLVGYYVFVIKCCLNWRRPSWPSSSSTTLSRRARLHRDLRMAAALASAANHPSPTESRGLDESVIRLIPIVRFRTGGGAGNSERCRSLYECAVCLCEFQEEEKLRLLPNCLHSFHIDCIDTWLQSNPNCPLCRSIIHNDPAQLVMGCASTGGYGGGDMVVIEVTETEAALPLPPQEPIHNDPSPRKLRHQFVSSMGDECINVREKDEQFSVQQPIRRSFSMDSCNDRQLYLSVQMILQQQQHKFHHPHLQQASITGCEGSGGSSRLRRSLFSFGSLGRSSRSAITPIEFDV